MKTIIKGLQEEIMSFVPAMHISSNLTRETIDEEMQHFSTNEMIQVF